MRQLGSFEDDGRRKGRKFPFGNYSLKVCAIHNIIFNRDDAAAEDIRAKGIMLDLGEELPPCFTRQLQHLI
jgi:hypothetical protein